MRAINSSRPATDHEERQPKTRDLADAIRNRIAANVAGAFSKVLDGQSFRKQGNELVTKSPFREDRHWSLRINLEKATWYDDPEGAGGDLFSLVARISGLDV